MRFTEKKFRSLARCFTTLYFSAKIGYNNQTLEIDIFKKKLNMLYGSALSSPNIISSDCVETLKHVSDEYSWR